MTAVDTPAIQMVLFHRIPRTAQNLTNFVNRRLIKSPKTSRWTCLSWNQRGVPSQEEKTRYSQGRQDVEAAGRIITPFSNNDLLSVGLELQDDHKKIQGAEFDVVEMS